ncbi:MAG: glycosyltransferase family 4 protein [Pirellulales bacterium]|nr:glycosyltransferase family 4 protein [Pirellulales bacterium]
MQRATKNLVVDVQAVRPDSAGALTYIRGMLEGLSRVEHDYRVILVGHRASLNVLSRDVHAGVLELPLNTQSTFNRLLYVWRLRRRIEEEFEGGNTVYWMPFSMGIVSPFKRIKTIVTVHDLLVFQHPKRLPWRRRIPRKYGMRKAIAYADAIVCVSEFTKQQLYLLFGHVIADKKIDVIYEGYKVAPTECERTHAILDQREPFLLIVGVNKNMEFLLRCFHRLRREHGYAGKLYIVGNIGSHKEIPLAIRRYDLHQSVRCLGFVDDAELPSLYRACDAFVFPSDYEGFGLPILEASYYGARICTSDAASLAEVGPLCKAQCANPFNEKEFTQAIDRTLRMEKPSPTVHDGFSWTKASQALVRICDSLLAGD